MFCQTTASRSDRKSPVAHRIQKPCWALNRTADIDIVHAEFTVNEEQLFMSLNETSTLLKDTNSPGTGVDAPKISSAAQFSRCVKKGKAKNEASPSPSPQQQQHPLHQLPSWVPSSRRPLRLISRPFSCKTDRGCRI
jgi:hypothetical protein